MANMRAGVIGAGFIGPVHIEALQRLGVRVTAVCDFDEAKPRAAALKWSIPSVVTGPEYRRLVESPEVDVVPIASPNRYHHEMALAAIHGGKHCVCEKPLGMNSRETARIAQAARAAKTIFAVAFTSAGKKQNYQSYPVTTEDFASVLLRFGNGVHGNLAVSQVAAGNSKSPLYATAEDGHQEVKVCEAILRRHQIRRWVKV